LIYVKILFDLTNDHSQTSNNEDILRSVSLGACNPALAYKIYQADERFAALLPCHVMVQEQANGDTKVTFADPQKMFGTFIRGDHPELQEIADDAEKRLKATFAQLAF
jgi:uncharacterized protein (DUF302 family)